MCVTCTFWGFCGSFRGLRNAGGVSMCQNTRGVRWCSRGAGGSAGGMSSSAACRFCSSARFLAANIASLAASARRNSEMVSIRTRSRSALITFSVVTSLRSADGASIRNTKASIELLAFMFSSARSQMLICWTVSNGHTFALMMASTTFWLSTSGLSSVATRSRLAKPYPSICIQTVGFGVLLGFFSASCFSTRCRHSVPACFCMCRCSACTRVPTAPPSRKRSRTSPSEHNTPRRCAAQTTIGSPFFRFTSMIDSKVLICTASAISAHSCVWK
mmetsp:Transcript_54207/g.90349  ORF Transcript_54207/g.90349 Transcript_54207/m.90349 type:complete len:274 (+) Transcript_54207:957-1778(+)